MQRPEQVLAEQRKHQQDDQRDAAGTDRHIASLCGGGALGQPGIDRSTAGRIDDHEKRDEGGEEEKEYNEEDAKEKLSEAGFKKNKLPEGIVKADKSIKQALENGFNENKKQGYKPAPGNAGSLMNECFSVVGVNMIDAIMHRNMLNF